MAESQRRGKKRTLISISSSSEEEDQSQSESESESESDEEDDYHQDTVEDISSSTSSDDDDDDDDESEWSESDDQEYEEDEFSDNEDIDQNDEESMCDRVIHLLREGSDIQELNLTECKSYLRKHGLRLSGTKAECIQRIKEHWRIKDGNGDALYPRSSFTINCTGDVCKGDVVLFTQKVYKKFDKVTRRGNFLGKRTVAGRIVNESYGAAKQQHTFTVEVLWTKGIKKLPPLFALLVKGRNLYKLKTFRQHWKNEEERSNVLAEKHKRGAAARLVRTMKRMNTMKKSKKKSSTSGGAKRQKHFHQMRPSQMRQATEMEKGKCIVGRGKMAPVANVKSNNHHQKPPARQLNLKQTTKLRAPTSYRREKAITHPNNVREPTVQSYAYAPPDFHQCRLEIHHQRAPLRMPSDEGGYTWSTSRFPHLRPYVDASAIPASEHQQFNHGTYPHYAHSHPTYEFELRNLNRFSGLMSSYRPPHPFPWRTETYGQRKKGY